MKRIGKMLDVSCKCFYLQVLRILDDFLPPQFETCDSDTDTDFLFFIEFIYVI